TIEQYYFEVREHQKLEALSRSVDLYNPKLSIVFCNTKKRVDEVTASLQARSYTADAIHGDMNQNQRDRVMAKFRKGTIEILVATDVAARGIDVDDVEAVFNYDVPKDDEDYIHRIGRTGRAGRTGKAFSFVAGKDIYKLRDIQRYSKVTIRRKNVPSLADIENVKTAQLIEKVKDGLKAPFNEKYVQMVENLIDEDTTSLDIAAVLLRIVISQDEAKEQAVSANKDNDTYQNTGAKERGMARLFINIGKKQNVRPGDFVGAIAGETGLAGNIIGNIKILEAFSFVEVPIEHADAVIDALNKTNIKGRRVSAEPAKETRTS
ncbi:MAG: DbpA RNA binding domain-containing protein, partial [Elusimicrobia bacterium]|nr:DbpA RNA binding domain-containing protein [Elusimicrobiota bacterium]